MTKKSQYIQYVVVLALLAYLTYGLDSVRLAIVGSY